MFTVAVDRDRPVGKRLDDKIWHHPPVVRVGARAISIEDSGDSDVERPRVPIRHGQRLTEALGLVVHRARAGGTHISPVALALRVLEWVAVDLGSAGIQKARACPNRQFEQVTRAFAVYAHRLDREARVARRTGRTREVVDPLDLDFGRAFYQVQVEQLEA